MVSNFSFQFTYSVKVLLGVWLWDALRKSAFRYATDSMNNEKITPERQHMKWSLCGWVGVEEPLFSSSQSLTFCGATRQLLVFFFKWIPFPAALPFQPYYFPFLLARNCIGKFCLGTNIYIIDHSTGCLLKPLIIVIASLVNSTFSCGQISLSAYYQQLTSSWKFYD